MAQSLREQLIGAWKLVSYEEKPVDLTLARVNLSPQSRLHRVRDLRPRKYGQIRRIAFLSDLKGTNARALHGNFINPLTVAALTTRFLTLATVLHLPRKGYRFSSACRTSSLRLWFLLSLTMQFVSAVK